MFVAILIVLIAGYFIGCIHGSNVAQMLSGVNLKEAGLGNAGASNATLSLGWKYGILVALMDIGKGVLAIILARYLLFTYSPFTLEQITLLLYLTGAAVILGHNFPIHMKFRGGKGTASLIGVFIALDWKIGLLAVAALIITALLTNYLIIGVLILYLIFAVYALFVGPLIWPFLITILLFFVAVYLHFENVNRLRLGKEPKVTSAFKKNR